ncbi:hypothetical protein BN133_2322 [Cronobacter dublinensis 582]|nr:hypothetical protein BN133_2322 [Cronobacter dublinensis 582]
MRLGKRREPTAIALGLFQIDLLKPGERGAQPNNACDVRRARLEAIGHRLGFKTVKRDLGDHFPAAEPGRHLLKQRGFAIQHADAGRAIKFVAGEGVEIDVQRLHIRRAVDHALRAIDHHHRICGMGERDGVSEIRTAAGDVGHLAQRQQTRARGNQRGQRRDIGQVIGAKREFNDRRAGLLGYHQPRHQIGVVLSFADDNFIAGRKARTSIALGDNVDGFGRAARPDDIAAVRRVNETRDAFTGGFIARGEALRFGKLAAVDIPRAQRIKLLAGFNHGQRFKRRGGAVEIHGVGQRRELRTKHGRTKCFHDTPLSSPAIVAHLTPVNKVIDNHRISLFILANG